MGGPIGRWFIEHAGEGEGDLEESPAIESEKVDRRGLDGVIDFEGEATVRRAEESVTDGGDAFTDGEIDPWVGFGDQLIKAIFPDENGFEWKDGGGSGGRLGICGGWSGRLGGEKEGEKGEGLARKHEGDEVKSG